MASQNYLSLMPKFSSISLGCRKPMNIPDLRSRSTESSNISLVRQVHHLAYMNSGDNGKIRRNIVSADNMHLSQNSHERNIYRRYRIYNTKIDVRYLREVNKYTNKTLNQSPCPKIREKLNQNKTDHYRQRSRPLTTKIRRDKGNVNVSPIRSELHVKTLLQKIDNKSVQTDITLNQIVISQDILSNNSGNPLKPSETVDIEPNINFYKAHLQSEIINWLLNIPIFFSVDFTPKKLKYSIAESLACNIDHLSNELYDTNYETKVKDEINECLNILPMWLPSTKLERDIFKNVLSNKLVQKVQKINSKFLNNQNNDKNSIESKSKHDSETDYIELNRRHEKIFTEIYNWLNKISFNRPVFKRRVVELIMKKISSLLYIRNHTASFKLMLKGEILDVLNDLPIKLVNVRNKALQLNRYAEDLACRLMTLQVKLVPPKRPKARAVYKQCTNEVMGVPVYCNLKDTVNNKISQALESANIFNDNDVKEQICDVILNSMETIRSGIERNTNNEIFEILRKTNNISEQTALDIAKKIKIYVKIALRQDKEVKSSSQCLKPMISRVVSIYRSNDEPITSTPKQPTKKDIPKLNAEEISYMEQVATLIRAWMTKLPTSFDDDKNYKETIVTDLAGDIMDEVKREQLSPDVNTEKDKHLKYTIFRWLVKFDVFDDLNDAKPLVEEFLNELKQIPEPNLTAPQYGTRQAMENIRLAEDDQGMEEDFVPKGIDILEDEISVWLNEQPTEIYDKTNKKNHNRLVKDLALKIQDHLRNKSPTDEIETDIREWLQNFVKENERENLGLLTQNLKERVTNVPQDATLEARNIKRKKQYEEYGPNAPTVASPEAEQERSIQEDTDKTMKEFILKYMEHNFDIDDPMARGALGELLILELRKLMPATRKEVYDNFENKTTHDKFNPVELNDVLEYIKIISDWLKNLPIHPLYNTPGHRPRVDFVNDLARNIQEVEDKRKDNPNGMDYNLYISSVITESIRTYNIPVLPEHKGNVPIMVNQLVSKIIENRSVMDHNDSSIMADITQQNLSEFIQDYIRINGKEIAEDEVKLEAWIARLLEEVKKMVQDGANPDTLCKAQVYEKFAQVQIPEDEPVKRFSLEISYIKEISDWLKNLPLLPVSDVPETQGNRIRMITELAQKIADRDAKYNADPNDNTANNELVKYISTWISELPLDPRRNVVKPIVIQQLMNRIDKDHKYSGSLTDEHDEIYSPASEAETERDIEFTKDPGTHIVEFIENWCNRLPIRGDNPNIVNTMKSDIARNLYKKIGELNADPKIVNDNLLFRDLLEDEIDTQFENVPQDPELQNNREQLKTELLDTILELRNVIKENSAVDNYKHKLETSIDAAIPNPVDSRQIIEPGFEIYKNHLANMFILENFDHSNENKAKYEKRIRAEIDKYFDSALNKNALPMTKDQMYNELYSELFKVPMPKNESVGDKVEEIKTRYEIDAWFEDLPLKKTDDLVEQLEWDQILSTLAERIHDIEKNESEPDEKIRKEINKKLLKLPLQPGQKNNTTLFVDKLQNALKASAEARKYVPFDPNEPNKGKDIVRQTTRNESMNTSQVPGPYSEGQAWVSPPSSPKPKPKKSGELIVEIVEEWCNQLPLAGDETANKVIKDDLSTKIVMKIYELNEDADICNDEIIYDQLLDEELDILMANLVASSDFEQSKPARKRQLKEMIKSVIPIIREEKERHDYKAELNDTVTSILQDHSNTNEKIEEFEKLKDDIVDYFVEYNYNKEDDEKKQIYKMKVHDAVVKFFQTVNSKEESDPLVIRNQLLCELSKIPVPNDAVFKEIVEETKMKQEVEQLFEESAINDDTKETVQMKNTLTKRLIDIEKLGHSSDNDKKMNAEITKCINKLNKTVPPNVIDDFVNNLKNNESERNSPPLRKNLSYEDVVQRRDLSTIGSYRSKSPGKGSSSRRVSLPFSEGQPFCTADPPPEQYPQVPSQTQFPPALPLTNQGIGYTNPLSNMARGSSPRRTSLPCPDCNKPFGTVDQHPEQYPQVPTQTQFPPALPLSNQGIGYTNPPSNMAKGTSPRRASLPCTECPKPFGTVGQHPEQYPQVPTQTQFPPALPLTNQSIGYTNPPSNMARGYSPRRASLPCSECPKPFSTVGQHPEQYPQVPTQTQFPPALPLTNQSIGYTNPPSNMARGSSPRRASLPCPDCHKPFGTVDQHLEQYPQVPTQTQFRPALSLSKQGIGYNNAPSNMAINTQTSQQVPQQVFTSPPPDQRQHQPGNYEANAARPLSTAACQECASTQEYAAPAYKTPPLSVTVPLNRDRSPSSVCGQNNRNRSLPGTAYEIQSLRQLGNVDDDLYVSEYKRSYCQSPNAPPSNQSFEPKSRQFSSNITNGRQSMNYEYFKDGALFSSTAAPKPDVRGSGNDNSSPSLDRRSMYDELHYGRTTPRRVQDEAQSIQPSISGEETPESLFRAPTFEPKPLYSPVTNPVGEYDDISPPSGLSSGSCSRRRIVTNGVRKMSSLNRRNKRSGDREYRCVCDNRLKRFNSGPYCMIPMDEYCNECGGFYPMWCRMPLPGCYYLN